MVRRIFLVSMLALFILGPIAFNAIQNQCILQGEWHHWWTNLVQYSEVGSTEEGAIEFSVACAKDLANTPYEYLLTARMLYVLDFLDESVTYYSEFLSEYIIEFPNLSWEQNILLQDENLLLYYITPPEYMYDRANHLRRSADTVITVPEVRAYALSNLGLLYARNPDSFPEITKDDVLELLEEAVSLDNVWLPELERFRGEADSLFRAPRSHAKAPDVSGAFFSL